MPANATLCRKQERTGAEKPEYLKTAEPDRFSAALYIKSPP